MDIGKGHIIFALIFTVVFALVLVFLYIKDRKLHKKHYRRSWMVVILVAVLIFLFILLKNRMLEHGE